MFSPPRPGGAGAATASWGRDAVAAMLWAFIATAANVAVWVCTSPRSIGTIWMLLLAAPAVVLLSAGAVHRSGRVVLLAALFTLALNVLAFVLLIVVALSGIHWRT